MNHAAAATMLYRVGTCIEVLSKWLPPVQRLMSQYISKINAVADWHQSKALQSANPGQDTTPS